MNTDNSQWDWMKEEPYRHVSVSDIEDKQENNDKHDLEASTFDKGGMPAVKQLREERGWK